MANLLKGLSMLRLSGGCHKAPGSTKSQKVIQHVKGVSATKPVSTEARLQVEDGEVVVSCEAI